MTRQAMIVTSLALMLFISIAAAVKKHSPTSPTDRQAQPPSLGEKTEVELATLRRWGFEPREIKRPRGRFLLAVEDRAEWGRALTFALVEERGVRLKEVKSTLNGRKSWNGLFNLNPGTYYLRVIENPDWVCAITVSEK